MSNNFHIIGRHVEVTPALETYTKKKLSKLDTILHKITSVHVTLGIDNNEQTAKAEVKVAGDQKSIFAEATSDDLYKSIDALEDKLLRQVKKYHDEIKDHRGAQ